MKGLTVTVEMPHKQWTLVIGFDQEEWKYAMSVNGVEMSALPKAPSCVDSQAEFC